MNFKRCFVILLISALLLTGCKKKEEEEIRYDLIPQVMVDGVIYMDTGYSNTYRTDEAAKENWDGEITCEVPGYEQPTQNDQSNFGTGYGYRYGERDGTVELLMGYAWRIYATEQVREEIHAER